MKKQSESAFVKVIVFICGSVLMAVEIAGSRLLAPYLGNTIFVWASLISVLLAALACGYRWGGKLADSKPSFFIWGSIIASAGVFTLVIPFLNDFAAKVIYYLKINDMAGSLIASGIIFLAPSVLLGMVSPFAIKFSMKDIAGAGDAAGRLYAISAFGNIFGTLFTAFYLINTMRISSIFILLGLTLVFTSALIFFFERGRLNYAVFTFFLCLSLPLSFVNHPSLVNISAADELIFQKDSFYNHVVVSDNIGQGIRKLRFGKMDQAAVALKNKESVFRCTDMLHLPVIFSGPPKDVLFIGCGGGIAPRNFYFDYRGAKIDVVEIDPLVVDVSKKYFSFNEMPGLRVFVEDGRRFVQKSAKRYDMVIVDAFSSDGQVPFYMLTGEFLTEINRILRPKGVVAFNIIGRAYGERNRLFLSFYRTLAGVFRNVYAFPDIAYDKGLTRERKMNIILVATRSEEKIDAAGIYEKAVSLVDSGKIKITNLADYAQCCMDVKSGELDGVCILSDEYAPVEWLALTS